MGGSEREESSVRQFRFVIARGDAPELFQFTKHALDPIAILVGFEVAGRRIFAICFRRNDWSNAFHEQGRSNVVAVKPFVRQHDFRFVDRQFQQVVYAAIVRGFAACEDKAKRASFTV